MQPPHQSAHPYLYDTLDKQLISILRKDARASISKLAQVLQVSRGTVQNRLERSTTQVINKLRGIPQLEKLHTTNGAWDLVADIRATSLEEFDKVLREVRTIEGVLNSETSILLSTV